MNTVLRRDFALNFVFAATGFFFSVPTGTFADCLSPVNAIEAENCLPGNPASEWDIDGAGDASIQGFATDISVTRGETVQFKINSTNATSYTIRIYRMGYYNGAGARLVATISPSASLPQSQPACLTNATGLVDCGNWAVSASWAVPASATSGIYFARLERTNGDSSHIVFVVRNDSSNSAVLFQTSDTTWQAYNRYGGASLYEGSGPGGGGRAYKVSYNRPFTTRDYAPEDWLFNAEYPMVRWLERNGYDVSYSTGVDSDRRGAEIAEHKTFLSVGHDEYWSKQQRLNVEKARDQQFAGQTAPVHLAFLSGNEVFWKTRWESSIDASATAYRTLVCYKETHDNAKIDPSPEWTGTWRDPRFSPPADGGQPENGLTGTIFTVNGIRNDAIVVPAADAQMRFWRNTPNVSVLTGTQVFAMPDGTLGYEWDEDLDTGARPAGLVRLSTATLSVPGKLQDYGSTFGPGSATHHTVFYKRPSGALVWGTGTVQWPWGLDSEHDRGNEPPSVDMQQATVNILADMGVQPATLQPTLIPATESTDASLPASAITSPADGATVPAGSTVNILGTAFDNGGEVGGVEVSVDGGATWHPASGRETWSFSWNFAAGAYNVRSRAVDDSGNIEVPLAGINITAGTPPPPPGSVSIWAGGGSPSLLNLNDGQPIELGVRFRSSLAGHITGLRFYKGGADTGTHVGSLWTSGGSLLASAPFVGESASGWQSVTLSTPVAIAVDTTYVASYHSSAGYYVATDGYFSQAFSNFPLTALADGTDGANGLYRYGASGFPNQTYGSANYWADVVFSAEPAGPDTTPPTVVTRTPAAGATGVLVSANVSAGFSEALAVATVNGTTVQLRDGASQIVPATVTWQSATNSAVLDPTSALAYSTTYTATVKGGPGGVTDAAGNPLAADNVWTFTTQAAPPSGSVSIWGGIGSPSSTNLNDGSPIELGVKFRSSVAGFITGIRFYKGDQDTGSHVGHLWSASGSLLGTAVFTGETPSGWQEAALGSPVAIAANTTYVASYHSLDGYYVVTGGFFTQAVTNGPLTALADGTDGPNGLYQYGASGFPTGSYLQSNYWVDVLFNVQASGPDTTPPSVISTVPPSGATGVAVGSTVRALFTEALAPATVNGTTVQLQDASAQVVPASVSWDPATTSAVVDPVGDLAYSTTYTATIKGGSAGVTDIAANPLASDFTWTFTTQALPPPPPDEGPGGPVLVISHSGNPFSRYYAEILRAEGLNAFLVKDISTVNASVLAGYDVAILGEMSLSAAQVTMLTDWVNAGGNLIAMRPDKQLAGLLGLTDNATTLPEAYLQVATATAPGLGIVGQTMQFHGTADRYALAGASAVATLFSNPTTATTSPAVTLRSVGASGGQAAAFTFDLARSIVLTRQGNPAWAGQNRDGQAGPTRSDDMFYGAASFDPQPDWVNLDKVAIPQADEQQRLLANLILHVNRDRKPLPRFWYFPRSERAVVVMTSDNHGSANVEARFQAEVAASTPGCSVANWDCIRSSMYLYPSGLPNDATALSWQNQGFDVGPHINTGCADFTPETLPDIFTSEIAGFDATFPSLAAPTTNRTHCIAWSDWVTQPKVELQHGIRMDTNYYFWPPEWVLNRPGFFTGSGMPMRFADLDGTVIDVYQATTQMTDESEQTYPFTINTLLDRAVGPEGYYGAFTANIHADGSSETQAAAIVTSAKARGVPVISAKQLLAWIDGRNTSTFGTITWGGGVLGFTIASGAGANGIEAMLPVFTGTSEVLTGLTRGGSPVTYTVQAVKGVQYAVFSALAGTYQATYVADTAPPVISNVSVSVGTNGTATVQWVTNEAATSDVDYGTSPSSLTSEVSSTGLTTAHSILLPGLTANTTYSYRVTSVDVASNSASTAVDTFQVGVVDTSPPTVSLIAPNAGANLFTASPYLIQWTASDNVGVASIDVSFSSNGGGSYSPVTGCTGLPGTAQSCSWSTPGPVTTQGRVRVTARDGANLSASATSSGNFSVVSGSPSITLTAPITAVSWRIANTQAITFSHNLGVGQTVVIDVSRDSGLTWATINPAFVTTSATSGSFNWVVSGPPTTAARVRVTWASNAAVTSAGAVNFTILDRINITAPNTAVSWTIGSTRSITWSHNLGTSQSVNIDLSRDGGTTWTPVATNVPNSAATTGTFSWVVPSPATTQGRIRIRWVSDPGVSSVSAVNFNVTGTISMTAPASGNNSWGIGSTRSITWNHNLGAGQTFDILLSTDGGASYPTTIASGVAGGATSGTHTWVVSGPTSTTARVRVRWSALTTILGSTSNFTMANPSISVTAPNTAVNWAIGTTRAITWNHNLGTAGSVNIDRSTDGGATWASLATSVANAANTTGTWSWTVVGPSSTTNRIRVRWTANAAVAGQSAVNFTVANPFVTVTSPNTNVLWLVGESRNLTFNHNLGTGQVVNIDLSRDGGGSYSAITAFTTTSTTSGSFAWIVTGPATTQGRVRVTWSALPATTDVSNVNFRIQ